jgi:hypothetical protein
VRGDTDVARTLHRILPVRRIDRFIFSYSFHLNFRDKKRPDCFGFGAP